MLEYITLTKGVKKKQIQAFMRFHRSQAAFDAQPKFRENYAEMRLEQVAHGFGITRYNKKKHK